MGRWGWVAEGRPMKRLSLWAAAAVLVLAATAAKADDLQRWRAEAARVSIVRDDWGIAHVHGQSDADAVFGMVYAQAEDDFHRVEANYLTALGRTAEAEGEGAIWQDLRQRLYVDPDDLKAKYAASPGWLKALMDAWADGLNYLPRHPSGRASCGDHALRAVDGASASPKGPSAAISSAFR